MNKCAQSKKRSFRDVGYYCCWGCSALWQKMCIQLTNGNDFCALVAQLKNPNFYDKWWWHANIPHCFKVKRVLPYQNTEHQISSCALGYKQILACDKAIMQKISLIIINNCLQRVGAMTEQRSQSLYERESLPGHGATNSGVLYRQKKKAQCFEV